MTVNTNMNAKVIVADGDSVLEKTKHTNNSAIDDHERILFIKLFACPSRF